MTPRKIKRLNISTLKKGIYFLLKLFAGISITGIIGLAYSATDKAPKTKTIEASFINSELGEFKVTACNESTNPINWEEGIDSYVTRLKLTDYTGKEIGLKVNYPKTSTPENPACVSFTGSILGELYGTGRFYTKCDGNGMTNFCSNWKDPGKTVFRKKITHIIVDASAQSYDKSGTGEKYDSINPSLLENNLSNNIFTQAPGRANEFRNGLYQNPQKRPIICGDVTEEEKAFYRQVIQENLPQYINSPLFCTRDELLNPQDSDLRAFLWYISDCDIATDSRGPICNYGSKEIENNLEGRSNPLYSRRIFENNKDAVVIFLPAIAEELKTK